MAMIIICEKQTSILPWSLMSYML